MSATATDLETALAAAAALVRTLPAAELSPSEPVAGAEGVAMAIPAPGSKALASTFAGSANGNMVIVVSAELAAQIENGPIPQELQAGLTPGLTDACAALGDVHAEASQILDAEVALANFDGATDVTVIPLATAEGVMIASLVIAFHEAVAAPAPTADAAQFQSLEATLSGGVATRAVELLNDVEMGVTAELGRTRMTVRELLSMQPGSIVELDRAAGSPVDLLVNGTLVARGEVVVIDEEFGVRITEIIGYDAKKVTP